MYSNVTPSLIKYDLSYSPLAPLVTQQSPEEGSSSEGFLIMHLILSPCIEGFLSAKTWGETNIVIIARNRTACAGKQLSVARMSEQWWWEHDASMEAIRNGYYFCLLRVGNPASQDLGFMRCSVMEQVSTCRACCWLAVMQNNRVQLQLLTPHFPPYRDDWVRTTFG